MNQKSLLHGSKPLRVAFLVSLDILLINIASILALLILENFNWDRMMDRAYMGHIMVYSVVSSVLTILIFFPFKLYNSLWEFAGIDELMHVSVAGAIVSLLKFIVNSIDGLDFFPISYPIISGLLLIAPLAALVLLQPLGLDGLWLNLPAATLASTVVAAAMLVRLRKELRGEA